MSVPPDWTTGYHDLDKRLTVLERDISNKLTQLEKQNERIEAAVRERAAGASSLDNLSLAIQRSFDSAPKGRSQPVTMMGLGAALVVTALYFLKVQPW